MLPASRQLVSAAFLLMLQLTPVHAADAGSVDPDLYEKAVREYEKNIAELEQSGGAHDYRVGQELIGLGRAYKELGEYDKAIEAFKHSLHIIRINQGLESPEQFAVLALILEANTEQWDWEALDANYQYLYWLTRRVYEQQDPDQLLIAIRRIAGWHLHAYQNRLDPIPFKHLLRAEKLFQDGVKIIEQHYGPDDPRLIEALNGVALSDYHVNSELLHAGPDDLEEIRSSSIEMNVAGEKLSMRNNQHTLRHVISRINEIYANNPDLPVAERAGVLVNLGDWHSIYGWRGTAFRSYREAYHLLADDDTEADALEDLFGKATRIPSIKFLSSAPDTKDAAESTLPYIKLSYEVTAHGAARRVEIMEASDPGNVVARRQAREYLRNSLFRPRFVDGEPVTSRETIVIRHR